MLARAGDVRDLAAGTLLVPLPPRLSTVPENDELMSPRQVVVPGSGSPPGGDRRLPLKAMPPVRRLLSSPLATCDMPRLQSTPTSAPSIAPRLISNETAAGPPHVRFSAPSMSTMPSVSRATFSPSLSRSSPIMVSRASVAPPRTSPFATSPSPTRTITFPPPNNNNTTRPLTVYAAASPTSNNVAVQRNSPLHWHHSPPTRTTISPTTATYRSGGGESHHFASVTSSERMRGVTFRDISPTAAPASPLHRNTLTTATISSPLHRPMTRISPPPPPAIGTTRNEELAFAPAPTISHQRPPPPLAMYTVPTVMYAPSPTAAASRDASPVRTVRPMMTVLSPTNVTRGSIVQEPVGWVGAPRTATSPVGSGGGSNAVASRNEYLAKLQAKLESFQSVGLSEQIEDERRRVRKGVRMAPRDPKFTARLERLSELRLQRVFDPSMDVNSRVLSRATSAQQHNTAAASVAAAHRTTTTATATATPQIRIVPPANNPFLMQPVSQPTAVWRSGRRVEMGPEELAALKKIYSMDASTLSIISRSVSQARTG